MSEPRDVPDERPAEPRVIGDRYEVIRVLGEGTSASTLLCSDRRTQQQVAVKELHFHHLENWKYLELFEREAKVLSLLDHQGIPKVLDFFQRTETSSTLYIVQEFVEGDSLKQRMESGPMLGQQEVHNLATRLLDVLDYLHGRAPPVLHRDIKPSNVLIGPDGHVALVDFGGVCFAWRPPGETGATVVGTFGYMPPEQLLGQSGPASDLYALGATLLHVLTGKPPSDFSFESGRIEVPADMPTGDSLARLIEALLRPAPRDRPQSAAAARQILIGGVPNRVGVASETRLPAARPEGGEVDPGWGAAPRFVVVGPSPRDLEGDLKDVYRNLVNPLFPAKKLWSRGVHAFWLSLAGFMSVATLGVAPLLHRAGVRDRKRRYADLFRVGRFTEGVIVSVEEGPLHATFRYEFDAAGARHLGFIKYATELAQFWGKGDTVPVLYDPDDPTRNCFLYR